MRSDCVPVTARPFTAGVIRIGVICADAQRPCLWNGRWCGGIRGKMRKNSLKSTRINGEVQRVLAEVIHGEIKDPRISPWTSVVSAEVAPDLKSCKVWVSVLGDEETRKATLEGLRSAEGFIKRQLARTINLRNTPDITFKMDQSIEYGVNMSRKIDEIVAQDQENAKGRQEDAEE